MYRIENKREYIKRIQKYLGVNQTGFTDVQTVNAIKALQKKHDVVESGVLSYKTFKWLISDYRNRIRLSFPTVISAFPYSKGDQGKDVTTLNAAIYDVLKELKYQGHLPRGDFYNEYTERAVKALRNIFGFKDENYVDKLLYLRIVEEMNAIMLRKKLSQ